MSSPFLIKYDTVHPFHIVQIVQRSKQNYIKNDHSVNLKSALLFTSKSTGKHGES